MNASFILFCLIEFLFLNFFFDYSSFGSLGTLLPLLSQAILFGATFYYLKKIETFSALQYLSDAIFTALHLQIVIINIILMLNTSQFKLLYIILSILLTIYSIYSVLKGNILEYAISLIILNSSVLFVPVYFDIGGSTLISMAVLSTLFYAIAGNKLKFRHKDPFSLLVILFALWITFSTIFSSYYGSSIVAYLKILSFIILFILISSTCDNGLKGVTVGILAVSILVSIFGALTIGERIAYLGVNDGLNHRLFLDDVHPSHIADFIVLVVILFIGYFFTQKLSFKLRTIGLISIIFILFTILFTTFSRSCWLGAVAGIFAYLIFVIYTKFKRKFLFKEIVNLKNSLILLLSITIFVSIYFSNPVQKRISGKLNIEGIKGSGRLSDWNTTLGMVKESPIWGNGLETRPFLYSKFKMDPQYRYTSGYFTSLSHNVFLGIASDTGILGLILFVAIILFHFIRMIKISNLESWILPSALFASIISILPSFLAGTLIDTTHILFWIILGTGQNLYFKHKEYPADIKLKWLKRAFILVIIILTLFNLFRFYARSENSRGEGFVNKKDYKNGMIHLERASTFFPFSSHYDFSLAGVYANLGLAEKVKESYQKAIKKNPSFAKYYNSFGLYLNSVGEYEGGIKMLQKAVELDPFVGSGKYYYDLGITQIYKKDIINGVKNLKESLKIEPTLVEDLGKLVGIDETIKVASMIKMDIDKIKNSGDRERLLLRLALLYTKIGAKEERDKLYLSMETDFPNSFNVLVRLIRFYRANGQTEKCVKISEKTLEMNTNNSVLFNEIGLCYYQAREYEKAKKLFIQSLKLWEEIHLYNYIAYKYLGLVYRELNNQVEYKKSKRKLIYLDRHINYDLTKMRQNQPESYIIEQMGEMY